MGLSSKRAALVVTCSFFLFSAGAEALAGPRKRPSGPPPSVSFFSTSSSVVAEARQYIGGNPTGRATLWCGAFMDLVLRRTGHQGGGNLASAYARYGTRVSGPQVGAIAVMSRKGGGHVGVVSGVEPDGDVIVISGNTWSKKSGGKRMVLEQSVPPSRIYAYVLPK